jgi:hypothetical protein
MAVVNKRNAYLLSVGWWLAKRRLRARALELVSDEKPARRRIFRFKLILLAALAGGAAYVAMRRRSDRDNGWISYQPVDLNGKGTADVAATAVPATPAEE